MFDQYVSTPADLISAASGRECFFAASRNMIPNPSERTHILYVVAELSTHKLHNGPDWLLVKDAHSRIGPKRNRRPLEARFPSGWLRNGCC
jgi:hypothetical protein